MVKFSLALVTGATSGIGKALCELLANQGISLIITGREEEKLHQIEKELQSKVAVQSIRADLLDKRERQLVINQIHDQTPDLVINNAGFGLYGDALTYTTEQQMQILELNGTVTLELTLEAARSLASRGKPGTILNVSSAAAFQVFPVLAIYASAKTFVNQFSQALDAEMKPYGIRVLAACPGMVDTQFTKRAGALSRTQSRLLKSMTPEFVAQAIWHQIQIQQPLTIIDWKYRLLTCFTRLLPQGLSTAIVRNNILKRIAPRTLIKVNHDNR